MMERELARTVKREIAMTGEGGSFLATPKIRKFIAIIRKNVRNDRKYFIMTDKIPSTIQNPTSNIQNPKFTIHHPLINSHYLFYSCISYIVIINCLPVLSFSLLIKNYCIYNFYGATNSNLISAHCKVKVFFSLL